MAGGATDKAILNGATGADLLIRFHDDAKSYVIDAVSRVRIAMIAAMMITPARNSASRYVHRTPRLTLSIPGACNGCSEMHTRASYSLCAPSANNDRTFGAKRLLRRGAQESGRTIRDVPCTDRRIGNLTRALRSDSQNRLALPSDPGFVGDRTFQPPNRDFRFIFRFVFDVTTLYFSMLRFIPRIFRELN
jgi:hypothetical protein